MGSEWEGGMDRLGIGEEGERREVSHSSLPIDRWSGRWASNNFWYLSLHAASIVFALIERENRIEREEDTDHDCSWRFHMEDITKEGIRWHLHYEGTMSKIRKSKRGREGEGDSLYISSNSKEGKISDTTRGYLWSINFRDNESGRSNWNIRENPLMTTNLNKIMREEKERREGKGRGDLPVKLIDLLHHWEHRYH